MKELTKKGVLKIATGSVFILVFILALMYPVISARHRDKIYFLMSPNPHAVFSPPPSKDADVMIVWISVIKDSTYGSFAMAMVGYETYGDVSVIEYHWYTNHLRAGETFTYLGSKTIGGEGIEYIYDVTHAKIDVIMSEHQLNATVMVEGKVLFTAGFWADTSVPVESRIEPTGKPPEVSLSVEAYRPTLSAFVTGLEVGEFTPEGSRFDYIDTELVDSSLLP